jgi:hypothetical protein
MGVLLRKSTVMLMIVLFIQIGHEYEDLTLCLNFGFWHHVAPQVVVVILEKVESLIIFVVNFSS